MNYSMIRYILGKVIWIEGILFLFPCLIALIFQEREGFIYLLFAAIGIFGGWLISGKPKDRSILQREGFVSVGLAWVVLSCFGALPLLVAGEVPTFIDGMFEIASGFTTTGSSILIDLEAVSHASLFWRAETQWIGGMGVLVFLLMMAPSKSGGSHMNLMKAESPGPDVGKFVPRVGNTARVLYFIYTGMTIIMIIILLLLKMDWFDTFCISFATAGTGGFSVLNTGCATYTPAQQWVITIFMALFGVNFSFYFLMLGKKFKEALKLEEVWAYILILVGSSALIAVNIAHMSESVGTAIRDASFQVSTIMTTTGFATTDFDAWPSFSKTILLLLMMIGACAGSTGGGIKVSRILVMFKSVRQEFRKLLHPYSVSRIRLNGAVVEKSTLRSLYVFFMAYFLVFGISFLIISIDGFSMESNISAVAATLNNIGPGFDAVGPTSSFAGYSLLSKVVLTIDMIAGRLELMPLLILAFPGTWKRS
ncbi:MAG: TrkH family potassium uptake protein [Eubacterium sp.]|nr:TrkH family potassium uptake protein [Eubacterium sp.]